MVLTRCSVSVTLSFSEPFFPVGNLQYIVLAPKRMFFIFFPNGNVPYNILKHNTKAIWRVAIVHWRVKLESNGENDKLDSKEAFDLLVKYAGYKKTSP